MLICSSQVPSAAGPSTRVGTGSQPKVSANEESTNFVPLQRASQVQFSEDMIRLLHIQLEEKSQRVKDLEVELKDCQSRVQSSNDREDFLLAELAAQVHDLDCKLLPYLQISVFFFACTPFVESCSPQVSKVTQLKRIVLSKTNFSN